MSSTTDTTSISLADRVIGSVQTGEVQLPPLPELALRLRELLAREDQVDAQKVADLVMRDPAVAASILRIANSAAFGGLRPVTGLNQAIARLGLRQVGALVTALTLKGNFTAETADKRNLLHALWDHAVAVAFCAKRIAPKLDLEEEQAFLAGLLHDCGHLVVLKAVDHLQSQGLEIAVTRPVLEELMETLHTRLGHMTLVAWKLPEELCRAVELHEEPAESLDDPLVHCVQAADLVSKKLGFHMRPRPELVLLDEAAIEAIGLGDIELATLMVDLEDELAEVRRLL